jgi:ATP-binding cassette subfamily B protein
MIFGRHINRYYLKHLPALLLGVLSLVMIDILQLKVPELYGMVINGIKDGAVEIKPEVFVPFDMDFLLDSICLPMIVIIVCMAFGRFLWRICFFG